MSVAKVVTASGDLVIPAQSIIYGITINAAVDPTGAGMTALGNVTFFNAATQATGTPANTIVLCNFFADPQAGSKNFQYLFPAGVRCLNGGSVTIVLSGADSVNITIDYS